MISLRKFSTCLQVNGYTFMFFYHSTKGNNLCDVLFAFFGKKPFQKGSTLKEKNLLLEQQIVSYKSLPILQKEAKKENDRV